jgi:opacity protein-like surface antigen
MVIFRKCKKALIVLFALFSFSQGQAQDLQKMKNTTPVLTINSNLLYDATTSMNLGLEFKLNERLTLKLPVTYNPWTFKENKKFKFIWTQPELRWWLCEAFSGHFFGLHGHYAQFNVGSVGTDYMKKHRYEGDLYGGGISYGYQFYLAPRWSLEASIGVGYAHMEYDVYKCETCGEFIKSEKKDYFGPTQAGISLIYIIK